MKKPFSIHLIVAFAVTILMPPFISAGESAQRPNIVIFLTDDQGYGELGCYGHPDIRSPHIDRLAGDGMRFTQAYSASSVCSPSRSAILTGRTPYRNGVYRWIPRGSEVHLRESEVTLPELLKEQGYATCHVGKWHLNAGLRESGQPQPGDHGYDHFLATQNNARPSHRYPTNFVRNGEPIGKADAYSAHFIVEEAIQWLKEARDPESPFFLTVWTHEIHRPVASAPRYRKLYPDKEEATQNYYANVTQLDAAFGELMKAIDHLGEREETLVFFTSDNGPTGGGPERREKYTKGLRGNKRDLFEGGIRVPFIAAWPGHIPAGAVNQEPIVGSDIFTTVCDIVGLSKPTNRDLDGTSIAPAFDGKPIQRSTPLYWRMGGSRPFQVAMRKDEWKILATDDFDWVELYHLAGDPKEQNELSQERPEVFKRMKDQLLKLNEEIEQEGPDWWQDDPNEGYARAKRLPKGEDQTGEFDVVRGGVVSNHSLGYRLNAQEGEAIAMRELASPIQGKATFRIRYRTLVDQQIRNALFVFGKEPTNDTIKVGTAIGMGQHVVMKGGWGRFMARLAPGDFDASETFELDLKVNLRERKLTATIGGNRIEARLPKDLDQIEYVGVYAKQTESAFSPIEVIRGDHK